MLSDCDRASIKYGHIVLSISRIERYSRFPMSSFYKFGSNIIPLLLSTVKLFMLGSLFNSCKFILSSRIVNFSRSGNNLSRS
jgi:hypothetical protein